jgi:hypothetical protein
MNMDASDLSRPDRPDIVQVATRIFLIFARRLVWAGVPPVLVGEALEDARIELMNTAPRPRWLSLARPRLHAVPNDIANDL